MRPRTAMQLWKRQRGDLRPICKNVYEYHALTDLLTTYVERGTKT